MVDANWWATQRATRSNAHIALENAMCANAQMLLHPNRQPEMHNADCQAHQGQREQLLEERRKEIRNANRQAHNA